MPGSLDQDAWWMVERSGSFGSTWKIVGVGATASYVKSQPSFSQRVAIAASSSVFVADAFRRAG